MNKNNINTIQITENDIKQTVTELFREKKLFLGLINFDSLVKATIMLLNRIHTNIPFNANVTVYAEHQETSNQYGEALAEIIEKYDPSCCLLVNEKNLYNRQNWSSRYQYCKVIVVKDYTAENVEKLYTILSEIEKDGWNPSIILCTTNVSLNILSEYSKQDYRLFHYLCGFKVNVSTIDSKNLTDLILERLTQNGYETTVEFEKKLDVYIRAVYPEARLQKNEFIDDLIYRIYQVHFQKIVNGTKLDVDDVPFSLKAERLWGEENSQTADSASNAPASETIDSSNASVSEITDSSSDESISEIDPIEHDIFDLFSSLRKSETQFDSGKDAGIFLVLSKYNFKSTLASYNVDSEIGEVFYRGIQTNDAPVQYLIDEIYNNGYHLKKIVCITTPEVENGNDGKNGVNTYERFRKVVQYYVKNKWNKDDFEITKISFSSNLKEDEDKVYHDFYKQLNQKTQGLEAFYADYTGGFRDTSFLMIASIRFLEFKGIKCEKVIYSDFFSSPKQLKTLDKLYALFQMINGMSEFVFSGTTRQLDDIFGQKNDLVKAIRNFAHATNVGDIENIDSYVAGLMKAFQKQTSDEDLNSVMFLSMNEIVSKKLFGENSSSQLIDDKKNIDYYRLIHWCLDNKMFQQAVTLYIEKVPVVYYKKGIISNLVELSKDAQRGSSKEVSTFYRDLPECLMDEGFIIFQEKLKKVIKDDPQKESDKNTWNKDACKNYFRERLKDFEKACQRLIKIIDTYYPQFFLKEEFKIYGSKIGSNHPKISSFLKALPGNARWTHYLFYNDENRYTSTNENDKTRTIYYIEKIYETSTTSPKTNDDKALCILLAFYLAIKLLRNKMSHAIEATNEEDEEVISRLEQFFKDISIDISISLKEDDIANLLKTAMSYTEEAPIFMKYDKKSSMTASVSNSDQSVSEQIKRIEVPDFDEAVTDRFKFYVQSIIFILQRSKNYSRGFQDIQNDADRLGVNLPEKREMSKDGNKSGLKLLREYCKDQFKFEGDGNNTILTYLG